MEKFIGIHFLLQRPQRFCGLHRFRCKNSAGSLSRALNRPARLWISVSTLFSAIGPALIASSGVKPSPAELFQTKTERV